MHSFRYRLTEVEFLHTCLLIIYLVCAVIFYCIGICLYAPSAWFSCGTVTAYLKFRKLFSVITSAIFR